MCRWLFWMLAIAAAPCWGAAGPEPLRIPPPSPPAAFVPFPDLGPAQLDEANNRIGVAQATAREKHLQGRVLWIDATANIERMNTQEKVRDTVRQIRDAGFNTVVLDVKPIIGMTLYPTKLARKLTQWNQAKLPEAFDPLAALIKEGHAAGLSVCANLNVFSEGHRGMSKGPAYEHPEWQTVLCEPQLVVTDPKGKDTVRVSAELNTPAQSLEELTAYTSAAAMAPSADACVVLVDAGRRVTAVGTGGTLSAPVLPKGGAALVGEGQAGDFLRRVAAAGELLPTATAMRYVPMAQSHVPGSPVWVNPNNPEVQERMLAIIGDLVDRYAVDGVVFDDRMRYAALNADFSEASRKAFEEYVGKPLTWPDDVLRCEVSFPSMSVRVLPGPCMDAWMVWRALTVRNWLARALARVKAARPAATVGVYVGSWYGEYPSLGANWAADDFQAGFRFLTDPYRQTGFAGLLDWLTPGCYYSIGTVADAVRQGISPGQSVEAAGQFANRAANSQAWVYAGISLEKFDRNPEGLASALQAACASTQGVMVFDLSHKIEQFWPVFKKAFAAPARAPHSVPGLLAEVRKKQAERKAAGISDPPVIIQNGLAGTGL